MFLNENTKKCECIEKMFMKDDKTGCLECPSKPCKLCIGDKNDQGICIHCVSNDMHVNEQTHKCECGLE